MLVGLVLFGLLILGIFIFVLFVSVGTMLGKHKPFGIATVSAGLSAIYTWFIESTANISTHIIIPAWETLTGVRDIDLYGVGASIMFIGLIMVSVVAFFNIIITWESDRPFSLWR